jgi:Na+/H+ antiporter NhaA
MGASWLQVLGISLLSGIGFTMSLFIGLMGWLVLRFAPRRVPAPATAG